jgi:hypothetical protein
MMCLPPTITISDVHDGATTHRHFTPSTVDEADADVSLIHVVRDGRSFPAACSPRAHLRTRRQTLRQWLRTPWPCWTSPLLLHCLDSRPVGSVVTSSIKAIDSSPIPVLRRTNPHAAKSTRAVYWEGEANVKIKNAIGIMGASCRLFCRRRRCLARFLFYYSARHEQVFQ